MATSTARPSRRLSIRERLFHRKRVAKDAEKDDVPTTSDKLLSPSSIPAPRVPSSASLSSSNERGSVSMSATTLASRHGRSRRMRIPFYSYGKRASSFSVIKPQRTSASMSSSSPSVLTRIVQRVVPCVAQPFSPVDNPTAGNHAHPSLGVIAARAGATQSTLSPIQIPALSVDPAAPDTPASIAPLAHPTPDDPVGVTSASVQPVISPHSRDSTLFTPSDDTDASFTEYDPDDPHHAINSNPLAPSAQPGSSPTHPMPPPYGADLDDDDYPDDMQLHDDIDIAIHDDYDAALRAELAEEGRLIRNGGAGIPIGPDGKLRPLLPPALPRHACRPCLVLDLDETLVHSSFKPVPNADFVVPVEIERQVHHFHVLKRPGVDEFLRAVGELFEVVVFTASLGKYADPVLDTLDMHNVVTHRLFREACYPHRGNYVKDLSQLGRPLSRTLILDNAPASYVFHPRNAVPVSSWFQDAHDAELKDLVPFLKDVAGHLGVMVREDGEDEFVESAEKDDDGGETGDVRELLDLMR